MVKTQLWHEMEMMPEAIGEMRGAQRVGGPSAPVTRRVCAGQTISTRRKLNEVGETLSMRKLVHVETGIGGSSVWAQG